MAEIFLLVSILGHVINGGVVFVKEIQISHCENLTHLIVAMQEWLTKL